MILPNPIDYIESSVMESVLNLESITATFYAASEENLKQFISTMTNPVKKEGRLYSFKDLDKAIDRVKEKYDENSTKGQKVKNTCDPVKLLRVIKDFEMLGGVLIGASTKSFSDIRAYEKFKDDLKDTFDDFETEMDRIFLRKADFSYVYLITEYGDLLEEIKKAYSYDKAHKKENVIYVVRQVASNCETKAGTVMSYNDRSDKSDTSKYEEANLANRSLQMLREFTNRYKSIAIKIFTKTYGQAAGFINQEDNRSFTL